MFHIILLPLISGVIITQTIKLLLLYFRKEKKFTIKNYLDYSGMPSGHSAIVVSLAAIIGLEEGLNSPVFGVSFIVAIIVIRDAVGLRRYLGQHGKILNILVKDLEDDKIIEHKYPHLIEKIGHTPAQVIVGGFIGFLVSVVGYWVLN